MATRPQLDHWFRLGFVVRGLVMIALGYLAFASGRGQSPTGLVERIGAIPGGQMLLLFVIVGMTGFALFEFADSWLDLSHCGSDLKGQARRLGHFAGGLGYLALAGVASLVLLDLRATPSSPDSTLAAAEEVRQSLIGAILLIGTGLGLIVAAVGEFGKVVTARFMDNLSPSTPPGICWIGRAGSAARGVLFGMLGWFTIRAGLSGTALRDSADVLEALSEKQMLFGAVTIGLVMFGVFSLIEARYRRVPDEEDIARRARQELDELAAK